MKRLALFLLVAFTASLAGIASAQQPGNFDPSEMMKRMQDPGAMQRMAAQAQAAQQCMEGIDQKALEAIRERAEKASNEIEQLCDAGKKKEALKKGMTLAKELQSNKTLKKMQECAKDMSESMKGMMPTIMPDMHDGEEPTESDICSR